MTIILSLFFYFLVERERSKRRLQEKILRSTQLQKENYQAQIQSLKNQVNPHFLFNSLNVLSSLIRKNQSQAREFVYRLSKVYRSFLDHSHEQLVPLQKEMELTEAYIYLLSTRFGDNVRFEINVSKDHTHLLLPPGSLQMLVENAIKHNGSTRKKPLIIQICSEKDELVVKNNLQPRLEKMESTRMGLKNITRRYKFLTNKEVKFNTSEKEFIAKLPLLKVEVYENSNY
ncbi:histidine kinase [Salegentibacter sp. JZCK2]|uniref:sensor histidine kinase n=1 Tax=Salegentibacter tibetensis TaxID=2873600 RepID=UPI001CCF0431|nr:histidine kinase [Salegentibacter tibetensis]MBZ9730186.1 histidine kinase [Salegentibacter tibetensis]